MAYIWADVLPGQVSDDVAINGLGNFVETLDTRTTALEGKTWTSGKIVPSGGVITISGIPGTLRRLDLSFDLRSDTAAARADLLMKINGSSLASYFVNYSELSATTQTNFLSPGGNNVARVGTISAATAGASAYAAGTIEFPDWSPVSGSRLKCIFRCYLYDTTTNNFYAQGGVTFIEAGPYTSLALSTVGNLVTGSSATARGQF